MFHATALCLRNINIMEDPGCVSYMFSGKAYLEETCM